MGVRVRANKWMAGVFLSGLCLCQAPLTTAQTNEDNIPVVVIPPLPKKPAPDSQQTQQTPSQADQDGPVVVIPPLPKKNPPDAPQTQPQATPDAGAGIKASGKPVRLTLLLPLSSETLGPAAAWVRAGFLAAYEVEKDGLSVKIVSTTDIPEEIVSSYTNSLADSDIVIGPLTRNGTAAVAESGAVRLPTIALTQSDADSGAAASPTLPPQMLAMGLSVEDEAREAAGWIAGNKVKKVYVLGTAISWQRRAVKAFAARARDLHLTLEQVELVGSFGFLQALDIDRIKKEVQAEKSPGGYAIFAALDAPQTKQLREVIGNDSAIYGTSQMNPVPLPDRITAEHSPELNGVRLLDIPWQLQPDHAAVMIYPRSVVEANRKRNADMERLYALGIDAFRVALQIAQQQKQFDIDGVTGRLKVSFDKGGARFQRIEPFAIYREGLATYLSEGH
jgi:outer membrane PBP1 activator LpoA protein